MAQKKITDLSLRTDFDATCNLPVDDTSQTWRATGQQVKDFITLAQIASKTANYTLSATDDLILGDDSGGSFTLTLPTAVGIAGRVYTMKKTNSGVANRITIACFGAQTIDGLTTRKLCTSKETLKVISNGSNWEILEHFCKTEWTSFTMDITATANPTKGTIVRDVAQWMRDGSDLIGRWDYAQSTAGTAGTGNYSFRMVPSGLVIATSKIPLSRYPTFEDFAVIGEGYVSTNSTITSSYAQLQAVLETSSTAWFLSRSAGSSLATIVSSTSAELSNADEMFTMKWRVPIDDWFA